MPETPPSTPTRKRLSRDQRRDVLLMRSLGYSYEYIATFLKISQRAVQYTCQKGTATPQHKQAGRPPKLNQEETDKLIEFVTSSHRCRRLSYQQLADELWPEGEIGADSIRFALRSRGFRRRIALRKPHISPQNKAARLLWAQEHVHWSPEQWRSILWTDETWVTAGHHRKVLVTRRPGEELEPTCILERIQRKAGWMFWGSFAGDQKGPSIFWEKDWGSINKESYCEHIVPVLADWFQQNSHYYLMQDNAPGHAARYTRQKLQGVNIRLIFWPAFSPDLNPIETLWNKMKDWLAIHYPAVRVPYRQLRTQVQEAWQAIEQQTLRELLDSMPARCQAVIDAQGGYTKY
jgi:transposase